MIKLSDLRKLGPTLKNRIIALSSFLLALAGLVLVFSLLFQAIMTYEGRQYSWISGFYWTLTTMSTLGFGDIAFTSDLGRLFSIVVLLSGIIFMLVLLPFMFIQFVYEPWVAARAADRVPRQISPDKTGHVILTFYGPVASALITRLQKFDYPYVVILPEEDEVLALRDAGIQAMCGALDDPETFLLAGVENAAMVATTRTDVINTTVAFTVRGISKDIPVVATAREVSSVDILKLAGCTRVLNLTELMASALARRAIGGQKFAHVVGRIDDLVVAEVDAARTTLIGTTLGHAQEVTAVSVVGVWTRGKFETGNEETIIEASTTLVMAGFPAQLKEFDTTFRNERAGVDDRNPVVIVGGGRVGRATAAALELRGIDYKIVEILPERIVDPKKYVLGSASDKEVMEKAGISDAPTVIITTHDDEINIFLTIFCRLIRPDIQIIARSTAERPVAPLHRAGSDMVISYASMGANVLFNQLKRSDVVMIAEGLDVFKLPVPESIAGKTLVEADIRQKTGCTVIGIDRDEKTITNPHPHSEIPAGGEIVLIGSAEGATAFLDTFSNAR